MAIVPVALCSCPTMTSVSVMASDFGPLAPPLGADAAEPAPVAGASDLLQLASAYRAESDKRRRERGRGRRERRISARVALHIRTTSSAEHAVLSLCGRSTVRHLTVSSAVTMYRLLYE
jgi:hypothetical protein